MDSPFPVNFENNVDRAAEYVKVLANRGRLIVMFTITRKPHSVSELVVVTGMSQPALSHHLARLRANGMVKSRRRGKEIFYSVSNRQLAELVEHICYQFQCWRRFA